jgi:hypothetical protein
VYIVSQVFDELSRVMQVLGNNGQQDERGKSDGGIYFNQFQDIKPGCECQAFLF